jgi:hypothetical protein
VVLGLDPKAVRAVKPVTAYDGGYVNDVEVSREDAVIGMGRLLRQIRKQYPEVPITFEAGYGAPRAVLRTAARGARLPVVGAHRRDAEAVVHHGEGDVRAVHGDLGVQPPRLSVPGRVGQRLAQHGRQVLGRLVRHERVYGP